MKQYQIRLQAKEKLSRSYYCTSYILTCNREWRCMDRFDCSNCVFDRETAIKYFNETDRSDLINDISTAEHVDIDVSVYEYDAETDSETEILSKVL